MSVLIKGIDMPKDGGILCITIYPDGIVCLNRDLECKRIATAVPVQPHGRLIDADALLEWANADLRFGDPDFHAGLWHTISAIEDAPTIIPAVPGREDLKGE